VAQPNFKDRFGTLITYAAESEEPRGATLRRGGGVSRLRGMDALGGKPLNCDDNPRSVLRPWAYIGR